MIDFSFFTISARAERAHHFAFGLFMLLAFIAFRVTLYTAANLAFHDERYSHLVLIPFFSAGMVYANRNRVFREHKFYPAAGLPLLFGGIMLFLLLQHVGGLAIAVFAMVLVWIAGFVLCYGPRSFRAAIFPLFFLLLMIPVPPVLLAKVVSGLQAGSAEVISLLFRALHVPVFREGYRFTVPHLTIEIAPQCSSIRSSTALFITAVLAGHFFLRSKVRRICLALVTVLIAMFTNAIRIVTLTCLAMYVDRGFLFGRLHRSGGMVFSLLSVAILLLLLFVLRQSEAGRRGELGASDLQL